MHFSLNIGKQWLPRPTCSVVLHRLQLSNVSRVSFIMLVDIVMLWKNVIALPRVASPPLVAVLPSSRVAVAAIVTSNRSTVTISEMNEEACPIATARHSTTAHCHAPNCSCGESYACDGAEESWAVAD